MSVQWLRLWHDMPNDPKWRTISKASGEPISLVISVYIHLLVSASSNPLSRGVTQCHIEDVTSALDCDMSQIAKIIEAMQGRVLDGESIKGWEIRQPKREDLGDQKTGSKSAAQRKREQRDRDALVDKSILSKPCHKKSRNVTLDKEKEKEKEVNTISPPTAVGGAVGQVNHQPPEFPPGFTEFWETWPKNGRKQSKGKCFESWSKAKVESDAAMVVAHVASLKTCEEWLKQGGQFVPAPLVYLNQRRWEGASVGSEPAPMQLALMGAI